MRDHQYLWLLFILLFGILPFSLLYLADAIARPSMWDILWLPISGGSAWFCARHWLFPWLSWLRHRRKPLNGLGPGLLADVAWLNACNSLTCSWPGPCARCGERPEPVVLYDRPMLDDDWMTWCTADDRWRVRLPNGTLRTAMVSQIRLRSMVDQLARLGQ